MPNKNLNFTIGADPEFTIQYGAKRLNAKSLLRNCFQKDGTLVENKRTGMGFKYDNFGELGWDGCSSTAELRPAFSNDPNVLTNNIKQLLTKLYTNIGIIDMKTTNFQATVGGHMHFSLPESSNPQNMSTNIGKKLSIFFMPILAGEYKPSENLRIRSNYGSINDVRYDNRKNSKDEDIHTMEYRVPNAEWLTSEKICRCTIAYMATVYNEIINHPNNLKAFKGLTTINIKQQEALHSLIMSDYFSLTKSILLEIKKAVKTFNLYSQYKEEVDYILNPEQVLKDKLKIEFNIVKGWGFDTVKIMKKDLLNEELIAAKSKDKNTEELSECLAISYNTDINCEAMAKEFGKRCIATNWRLKNTYFIYGLRDGLKDAIVSNKKNEIFFNLKQISASKDIEVIHNLTSKMFNKFENRLKECYGSEQLKILSKEKKETFIIGLPKETRVKMNIKSLINIIYNLERNPKPVQLNKKGLPNTEGKICEIFKKKEIKENEENPFWETDKYKDWLMKTEKSDDKNIRNHYKRNYLQPEPQITL